MEVKNDSIGLSGGSACRQPSARKERTNAARGEGTGFVLEKIYSLRVWKRDSTPVISPSQKLGPPWDSVLGEKEPGVCLSASLSGAPLRTL